MACHPWVRHSPVSLLALHLRPDLRVAYHPTMLVASHHLALAGALLLCLRRRLACLPGRLKATAATRTRLTSTLVASVPPLDRQLRVFQLRHHQDFLPRRPVPQVRLRRLQASCHHLDSSHHRASLVGEVGHIK